MKVPLSSLCGIDVQVEFMSIWGLKDTLPWEKHWVRCVLVYPSFCRVERDLRQKRQLLDAQRDKMKTLSQQAADDQTKAVS